MPRICLVSILALAKIFTATPYKADGLSNYSDGMLIAHNAESMGLKRNSSIANANSMDVTG
jgi:hypothetical protein